MSGYIGVCNCHACTCPGCRECDPPEQYDAAPSPTVPAGPVVEPWAAVPAGGAA